MVLTHVPPSLPTNIDLASSVANVAETFVHQELDPIENRVLRDTIHQSRSASVPKPVRVEGPELRLPGGLDPFTSGDDSEELSDEFNEAEEVSFLTSLTESLLSRLRISIVNTSIAVVHDGHAEVHINIPEMHFGTEDAHETPAPAPTPTPDPTSMPATDESKSPKPAIRVATTRTFRLSGLFVSMKSISQSPFSPPSPSFPRFRRSRDPPDESDESSSSEDEMSQMRMSESVLSVRSSASMYHSAMSLPPPLMDASVRNTPSSLQVSLDPSFTTTILTIKDPIVVQVVSHPTASYRSLSSAPLRPKVSMMATVGVVGVAVESWHIKSLLAAAQFVPQSSSTPPSSSLPAPARTPTVKDTLTASLHLRAVVILLLGPDQRPTSNRSTASPASSIQRFFERPLAPYSDIQSSHLRLQLDHFDATFSKKLVPSATPSLLSEFNANLNDLFVVYLKLRHSVAAAAGPEAPDASSISPVLILDPHLAHVPAAAQTNVFPFVDIISEWEKQATMLRPSVWRTRAPQPSKRDMPPTAEVQGAHSTGEGPAPAEKRHAIAVRYVESQEDQGEDANITLLPIHCFVDLEMISQFMIPFLDRLTPARSLVDDEVEDNESSVGSIDSEEIHDPNHVDSVIMETPRPRRAELEPEQSSPLAYHADTKQSSPPVCQYHTASFSNVL